MSENDSIDPGNRPVVTKPMRSAGDTHMVDGGFTWPRWRTMRESRSLSSQLLIIYGAALAIGLQLGLITLYIRHSVTGALWSVLAPLFYATVTVWLWHWVLPRFSAYPLSRRIAAQTLVTTVSFAIVSLISIELHALILGGASILRSYEGGPMTITIDPDAIRRAPLVYGLISMIPAVLLTIVGFNQHWWRIFVLQDRQQQLQELAASAQLAALRAQINPHFLFNSLNTIAQLISVDPVKAEACVERLAEIFRYMLTRAHTQFVSLADELSVVEAYLEIERARFGDDLVVEERVEHEARHVLLPGLILQPLVENAVKHGISRKIGGGRVTIEARVENGDLRLAVRDTGVGVSGESDLFESGIGLRNVRDRLLSLYGSDYGPEIVSRPGVGTTVRLRIPVAQGTA